MPSVLLITRDASTERLAERALTSVGHDVITAGGSDAAIRSLLNVSMDVVILDSSVGADEINEFCGWLRSGNGRYPLVFITAAGNRWLAGSLPLDSSRNEIVVKPFGVSEIRRAVEKSLDATEPAGQEVLTIGEAILDKGTHELRGDGVSIQLTPTEFRLVYYLVQRRGSIVSVEELLEKVWEFFPGTGSSELVRSHVRNLRGKLHVVAGGAELVQTVPRRGYRLL